MFKIDQLGRLEHIGDRSSPRSQLAPSYLHNGSVWAMKSDLVPTMKSSFWVGEYGWASRRHGKRPSISTGRGNWSLQRHGWAHGRMALQWWKTFPRLGFERKIPTSDCPARIGPKLDFLPRDSYPSRCSPHLLVIKPSPAKPDCPSPPVGHSTTPSLLALPP